MHNGVVFLVVKVGAEECTENMLGMLGCEQDEHGTDFIKGFHELCSVDGNFVGNGLWFDIQTGL
jgi:hypothetical protein